MSAKPAKDDKAAGEPPKKSSKLIIILLIAVLAAILGVGGAVMYILSAKNHATEKPAKVEPHEEELIFVPMESFTANLRGNQERFAQVFVSIAVSDPKAAEPIKARTPILRDRILRIIGKKSSEELLTSEGKEALAKEILDGVKEALPESLRKGVKEILFTNFIVQ